MSIVELNSSSFITRTKKWSHKNITSLFVENTANYRKLHLLNKFNQSRTSIELLSLWIGSMKKMTKMAIHQSCIFIHVFQLLGKRTFSNFFLSADNQFDWYKKRKKQERKREKGHGKRDIWYRVKNRFPLNGSWKMDDRTRYWPNGTSHSTITQRHDKAHRIDRQTSHLEYRRRKETVPFRYTRTHKYFERSVRAKFVAARVSRAWTTARARRCGFSQSRGGFLWRLFSDWEPCRNRCRCRPRNKVSSDYARALGCVFQVKLNLPLRAGRGKTLSLARLAVLA
jgi:hypothetical protein